MGAYARILQRHKEEIEQLQENCPHEDVREAHYEPIVAHGRYLIEQCWDCGKKMNWDAIVKSGLAFTKRV